MLRSRHFFRWLRNSEVTEPTPTKLGRLGKKERLQAAQAPDTKICQFELWKRLLLFFFLIWLLFIFINWTGLCVIQEQAFLFCFPKRCCFDWLENRHRNTGKIRHLEGGRELAIAARSKNSWIGFPAKFWYAKLWRNDTEHLQNLIFPTQRLRLSISHKMQNFVRTLFYRICK